MFPPQKYYPIGSLESSISPTAAEWVGHDTSSEWDKDYLPAKRILIKARATGNLELISELHIPGYNYNFFSMALVRAASHGLAPIDIHAVVQTTGCDCKTCSVRTKDAWHVVTIGNSAAETMNKLYKHAMDNIHVMFGSKVSGGSEVCKAAMKWVMDTKWVMGTKWVVGQGEDYTAVIDKLTAKEFTSIILKYTEGVKPAPAKEEILPDFNGKHFMSFLEQAKEQDSIKPKKATKDQTKTEKEPLLIERDEKGNPYY